MSAGVTTSCAVATTDRVIAEDAIRVLAHGFVRLEDSMAHELSVARNTVGERLRPGDHLCGHSYGAVVSPVAAEVARDLRSLTVIEPPAFGLATDDPQVAA